MPYTHNYKLEIGDHVFKGEVEVSNAGIVAVKEDTGVMMPLKTKESLRKVLDILGVLPSIYTDFKVFKLNIK